MQLTGQTSNITSVFQEFQQEELLRMVFGIFKLSRQDMTAKQVKSVFTKRLQGSGCSPCRESSQKTKEQKFIQQQNIQLEKQFQQIQEMQSELEQQRRRKIQAPVQQPMPQLTKMDISICHTHKKEFSEFCKQDETLICQECLATTHSNHATQKPQEIIPLHISKVYNLRAQMKQREDEIKKIISFLQKGKQQANIKANLLEHFINQKIDAVFKGLVIKRKQYYFQIQQWKQRLYEETEGLITSWEQINNAYFPQNIAELLKLETNLQKLSTIDIEKINQNTMNFILNFDLTSCSQKDQQFELDIGRQLRNLKSVVTQGIHQLELEQFQQEQAQQLQQKLIQIDQLNKELNKQKEFKNFLEPQIDEIKKQINNLIEQIERKDRIILDTENLIHDLQIENERRLNDLYLIKEFIDQEKRTFEERYIQLQKGQQTEQEEVQLRFLNFQKMKQLEGRKKQQQMQLDIQMQKQLEEEQRKEQSQVNTQKQKQLEIQKKKQEQQQGCQVKRYCDGKQATEGPCPKCERKGCVVCF